jgi:hypothetical protein
MEQAMRRILSIWMALPLIAAFSTLAASAADTPPTIPPGSVLHVRLGTTITSKTNKPGDTFTGMVTQPIVSGAETVLPAGSIVNGHVAFVKRAGRIKGKAQMRVVLDSITTPEEQTLRLASTLEDTKGGGCGKAGSDEEGTIEGCGKSKKDAAIDAAMGGAIGAGAGAAVGIGHEIECEYYGNCGGPGMAADMLYGAGIGAGTALLYDLFKRHKEIILIRGMELTFVVSRTLNATPAPSKEQAPGAGESK